MAVKQRIGWIGTGRTGFELAKRLLGAGHEVAVRNRTRSKAGAADRVRRERGGITPPSWPIVTSCSLRCRPLPQLLAVTVEDGVS